MGVMLQHLQHALEHLLPDSQMALCAQLEAAQLNAELERGQRQVVDVERTFLRLKQSYEERKKGEKELMDQTRNEFNQYFGLCAPSANAMYSSNYMSKLVLCGCYMLCCIVLGCALLCMLTCILAGGCNFCWSLNAQLQQRQQLCFRKCYEQQLPA